MAKSSTTPDTNRAADIEQFKSMKMQYGDPKLVKEHVRACMSVNEVAGIIGKAGIGKTDVVQQLAKELSKEEDVEYGFCVIQLQHLEKEDLAGFPFPDPDDSQSVTMRLLRRLPREGKCEKKGILFLDEFNRADKSVTNAVFPLMEERRIGDWFLPNGWHVVLAGNISDDQYSVNEAEKDPAVRRRVCWIGMTCNSRQWLQYAKAVGMHRSVIEFIHSNPDALYDEVAHRNGAIGASPASWEKVSKTMFAAGLGKVPLTKVAGNIGLPAALQFNKFHEETSNNPPPPLEILAHLTEDEGLQRRIKGCEPGEAANLTAALLRVMAESADTLDPKVVEENLIAYLDLLSNDQFGNFVELLVQSIGTMSPACSDILEKLAVNPKYKVRCDKVQKSILTLLNKKSTEVTLDTTATTTKKKS
jgi:hypothetical protein